MRWLLGAIGGVLLVGMVGLSAPLTAQIRLIPQAKRDSVANPPRVEHSSMRFEQEELRFGTIDEEGGPWQGVFRWRNEGTQPLVITRVVTSCGCLKADYEAAPVVAGGEATLRVEYNPKGHPGVVYQRLFLYTNLAKERPTAILTLRGSVRRHHSEEGYAHRVGALLVEATTLTFSMPDVAERAEVRCLNDGEQVVEPQLDTLLTLPGITLRCLPAQLQPQERGRLVVEYDPEQAQRAASTSGSGTVHRTPALQPVRALYLAGEEPPRMRRIGIVWQQQAATQK